MRAISGKSGNKRAKNLATWNLNLTAQLHLEFNHRVRKTAGPIIKGKMLVQKGGGVKGEREVEKAKWRHEKAPRWEVMKNMGNGGRMVGKRGMYSKDLAEQNQTGITVKETAGRKQKAGMIGTVNMKMSGKKLVPRDG